MIPKIFSLLSVVFFLSLASPFEVNAQDHFYKHMEGKLDENIHLKADLIRIDGSLTGYYYYYFLDTLRQMDFGVHFGKSMPVQGTIKPDHTIEFKEFTREIEGSLFRGTLNEGLIQGDWVSSDGSKTLPFELQETYPEGTIAFYVHHLNEKGYLLEKSTSPAATVDLLLLLPKPYANAAPVDSVNAVIYREFFGLDSAVGDPQVKMKESKELFFRNYRKANADIYREGASSFDWEKSKAVRIQYNENQILSMEFFDYGNTGGAHGLSISKFIVISLQDGHTIRLDEIFRPDYTNDLRDILNVQVRKQYEIKDGKDLRDAGFFVENLEPTANFYLNKDGIGFFYNQYEVAPYAMGPVDVFVPYHLINKILDKEGHVYKAVVKSN